MPEEVFQLIFLLVFAVVLTTNSPSSSTSAVLSKTIENLAPKTTKQILTWAGKKLSKSAAQKLTTTLGAAAASGPGAPAVGTVVGLMNIGMFAWDIVSLVTMLYESKSISEEQRNAMIETANAYTEYKVTKDYMAEPSESTKSNK